MSARVRLTMALLRVYRPEIVRYLRVVMDAFRDVPRYERFCAQRLEEMLRWCRAIPFYHERFAAARLFEGDRYHPERLAYVQPLTKEDIRQHFAALQHPAQQPGRYENTSGGSTGEPVRFVQDELYHARATADTMLFGMLNGKQPGEREIKLWGSERDLLEGSIGLREKLINLLYNRVLLNSFAMDAATMRRYVGIINRDRPAQIWTYVDSILELVRFARTEGLAIYNPRVVVCTAGTLYPEMRAELAAAFPASRIVNQYGSREVGQIATDAAGIMGMWIMRHANHVELMDDDDAPITAPAVAGRVLVTTLNNRSMPLVRFEIGDIAEFAPRDQASHLAFARVLGRDNTHFITAAGQRVHGEFFTHLFYQKPWLKAFQVVQTAPERVEVRYVPSDGVATTPGELRAIEEKIQQVMGTNTAVRFEPRPKLERLASGKFVFVKREFA